MVNNNVNSTATIVSTQDIQPYSLGSFNSRINQTSNTTQSSTPQKAQSYNPPININNEDPLLIEIQKLTSQVNNIEQKITDIQNGGKIAKDLDKQIVIALKDLQNYAEFFQKATFELEKKILKTSMGIAKKIIGVEIGEQSANIAKVTIDNILNKIKSASEITIHLNPKDYLTLKNELKLDNFIKLQEDPNIIAGGVVIASNLGNFDGSIEAKIETILESLDIVMEP